MIRRWLLGTSLVLLGGLTAFGLWRAAPGSRADAGRDVLVPQGTLLILGLESAVGSDTSVREDEVRAEVVSPVMMQGVAVVPAGSEVVGQIVDVARSGRVSGRARIAMLFHTLVVGGVQYRIRTSVAAHAAGGTGDHDALRVGAAAGLGALVGGIVGHGKGAAIGAAVGGGAETARVLATRGPEVRLGPGAPVTVRLSAPLRVRVQDAG